MRRDVRLPYSYDLPYKSHLRPYTGIANQTILGELQNLSITQTTNITNSSRKIEIIPDPSNPNIVSKTTVLGLSKSFG